MSRNANLAILLIAAALTLTGCQDNAAPVASPVNLFTQTREEMLVSTEWLAKNYIRENILILHIAKDKQNYDIEHIPNARFVAWDQVSAEVDGIPNELPPYETLVNLVQQSGIKQSHRIIIYDEEQGLFAARLYVVLEYIGLSSNAALLDGQLVKWKAEHLPLSFRPAAITPSEYTARIEPAVVISHRQMKDIVWSENNLPQNRISIIDARPRDQFSGETPGEGIDRPGHIPGAISFFWKNAIESDQNPILKPIEQLRIMFQQAGVIKDDLIVTYCRTGGQASHAYFLAKYLGYQTRIYDGSYIQWQRDPENKITKTE